MDRPHSGIIDVHQGQEVTNKDYQGEIGTGIIFMGIGSIVIVKP